MLDEFLVTRQAADRHAGLEALIQRHQPPGARRAHAHAGHAKALGIYLGPRRQVIQRDQVIAQDHPPERAPDPELEFARAPFALVALFVRTAGSPPISFAEAIGVYAENDKAAPREGWS